MIPISLYVIIEVLKLIQSSLIGWDELMCDDETDQKADCRNSDLIEELGQIEFVFSDKTGTLTQNKMEFKMCSIQGKIFTDHEGAIEDHMHVHGLQNWKEMTRQAIERGGVMLSKEEHSLQSFFTLMAVNHDVVVDKRDGELHYQASSPDELALVLASKDAGIELIDRDLNDVTLKVGEREDRWKILERFEFNSDRARSSVICHDQRNNTYWILTKGSDAKMLPRLDIESSLEKEVKEHLHKFAVEGLRTLVMAEREITEDDFKAIETKMEELKTSTDKTKDEQIAKFQDEWEQGLTYVGCSAIEDKL